MATEKRVRPLYDRIVVHPEPLVAMRGGIIIPDDNQERPAEGTVVRVGPGRLMQDGDFHPIDVKVGDVVLYGRFSGQDVVVDDKEFKLLREDEVLGVIEVAEVEDVGAIDVPPLDMPNS